MTSKITINLECPKCHLPPHVDDETSDESQVYCPVCQSKFGTYGEVKAKARELAKDKAQEMLRDVFKQRKGWKMKS